MSSFSLCALHALAPPMLLTWMSLSQSLSGWLNCFGGFDGVFNTTPPLPIRGPYKEPNLTLDLRRSGRENEATPSTLLSWGLEEDALDLPLPSFLVVWVRQRVESHPFDPFVSLLTRLHGGSHSAPLPTGIGGPLPPPSYGYYDDRGNSLIWFFCFLFLDKHHFLTHKLTLTCKEF